MKTKEENVCKKNTAKRFIDDIINLEENIKLLALSDSEKYDYFIAKLNKIKGELFENAGRELYDSEIIEVINEISYLEIEVNDYLKNGDISFGMSNKDNISGIDKARKHRLNLYVEILDKLMQIQTPDIERLKQVKQQWENEKNGKLEYSPIEIKQIEDLIADALIEFQIKSIPNNGVIKNNDISEFCERSNYETRLKERVIQEIRTMDEHSNERLELEQIAIRDNFEEMISNPRMWKLIARAPIEEMISAKEDKIHTEIVPINEKSISIIPTSIMARLMNRINRVLSKPKLVLKVEYKKRGQTVIKTKKYKLTREGEITYPDSLRDKIVEAIVPEGCERISRFHGGKGFFECTKLQKVTLPSTLKTIEKKSFYLCLNLSEINYPQGLQQIGEEAFYRTGLSSISLPQNVKCSQNCFSDCKELKEVTLPKNMEEVPAGMFDGCSGLTAINWPESLVQIGKYAFNSCKSLKETILPESLKEIENAAFANSGLVKVELPNELKKIGNAAFSGTNLLNVRIPNYTNCGSDCFANCKQLEEVRLPLNMLEVPSRMFEGCSKLEIIDWPEGMVKIGEGSFSGCKSLKETILPEKLKEIGNRAFLNSGLLKVELPNGLKMIGNTAFYGTNLVNVSIPDYTMCSSDCFSDCKQLEKVKLPKIWKKYLQECLRDVLN